MVLIRIYLGFIEEELAHPFGVSTATVYIYTYIWVMRIFAQQSESYQQQSHHSWNKNIQLLNGL